MTVGCQDVQAFKGLLLPGRDFTDAALLAKGKRVLVIGGGKTAADVAAAASAVAAETTLLFRRVSWGCIHMLLTNLPNQVVVDWSDRH